MEPPHGFDPARRLVDLVNLFTSHESAPTEAVTAVLSAHGESIDELSTVTEDDVAALRRACNRLTAVLAAPDADQAAETINALLSEFATRPHLSNHDGHVWHLHTEDRDAGWGDWLAGSGALALAQLMSRRGRIAWGVCSSDGCRRYYLDTGPGSARRYCSPTCATRARVAQHRARKRRSSGVTRA